MRKKAKFRNQVLAAKPVLERLIMLIDEKETALNNSEFDPKNFDTPSWPYLQAYKNGCKIDNGWDEKIMDLDKQVTKETS